MGEYVKYRGEETKIGTMENLYYTTYPKFISALHAGLLLKVGGSDAPIEYAKPNAGFRFRFPFPDEDKLPIGSPNYDFNRGVPVTIDANGRAEDILPDLLQKTGDAYQVEIIQQKLIYRQPDNQLCLAVICRDPSDGHSYRIEDDASMKTLVRQIIKHHIQNETNKEQQSFYREMALRILKGYRLNVSKELTNQPAKSLNAPSVGAEVKEALLLEHVRSLAYRAYLNTSFSPEKRAQSVINNYSSELKHDLDGIRIKAAPTISPEDRAGILTRYQEKYEFHLKAWLQSESAVASSMIVGPANFPADRMQKRRQWADNKFQHFREWRKRALKAIDKSLQPEINELEQVRRNLAERERIQRLMTSANKIVRKDGPKIFDELRALGLSEGLVRQILITGFQPYQLRNNNAKIKRLRTRVAVLEAKEKLAQTKGIRTEEIDGVKLVHNYQADRVQLIFDGKPAPEVISRLKSHGFRWTPSQKAWQRKLTNQAVYAAQTVIKGGKGI